MSSFAQYNAQFNLTSNIPQVMKSINSSLTTFERHLQGMSGKANSAAGGMERIGNSIQKISQNAQSAADGVRNLSRSFTTLDKNKAKVDTIASSLQKLEATLAATSTTGLDRWRTSVDQLATSLKEAAQAAKQLQSSMTKMGLTKAPRPTTPRTGGGGGRRPKDPNDVGILLPKRGMGEARALQELGSAAQGAAIGLSILERNIMGVVFGLVFMQFGVTKTIVLFTALTVAVGSAIGLTAALLRLTAAAGGVGVEFERLGQQMASFFRSGDFAGELFRQGEEISRQFAVVRSDATALVYDLAKFGQNTDVFIKGILNTAAATGEGVTEVSARWTAIMKADATTRASLIERFARDYSLPIKEYSSAVELATALNERFEGSAEAAAKTTSGMWTITKNNFQLLLESMGVIVNEIIKPIVELMKFFTEAMLEGFRGARDAAGGTDNLVLTMNELRDSIRKLIPWVVQLGNLLGRFLFWFLMKVVQAVKLVSGALNAGLKWWKEYGDEVRTVGRRFIVNFVDSLMRPEVIVPAIATFATTFLKEVGAAFKGPKVSAETDDVAKGFLGKLGASFKSLPKNLWKGLIDGLKAGLILALIEAVALTAVEFLPISEEMKTTLEGIIRFAILGVGLGSLFGPWGILIGGALGAAFAAGLELFGGPGTAKKWADKVDEIVTNGIKKIPEAVATAWGVLEDFVDWLTGDGTAAWNTNEAAVLSDNQAYADWSDDMENKHEPRIVKATNSIKDAAGALSNFFTGTMWPGIQDLWQEVDGPLKRAWESVRDLFTGSVWDSVNKVWDIFKELFTTLQLLWGFVDNIFIGLIGEWKRELGFLTDQTWLLVVAIEGFKFIVEVLDAFIDNYILNSLQALHDIFKIINDLLRGDWGQAWKDFKQLLIDLLELALAPIITLLDIIANYTIGDFSGIQDFFRLLKEKIEDAGGPLNALVDGIKTVGGWLGVGGGGTPDNSRGGGTFTPNTPAPSSTVPNSTEIPWFTGQHGMIVPGPRGTKQLVLAEAGEVLTGDPGFASATGRHPIAGGGNVIYMDLRGSTITDERAMNEFVIKIGNKLAGKWFDTRRMALPRSG